MQDGTRASIGPILVGLGITALVLDAVNLLFLKFMLRVPFLRSVFNPVLDLVGAVGVLGINLGFLYYARDRKKKLRELGTANAQASRSSIILRVHHPLLTFAVPAFVFLGIAAFAGVFVLEQWMANPATVSDFYGLIALGCTIAGVELGVASEMLLRFHAQLRALS